MKEETPPANDRTYAPKARNDRDCNQGRRGPLERPRRKGRRPVRRRTSPRRLRQCPRRGNDDWSAGEERPGKVWYERRRGPLERPRQEGERHGPQDGVDAGKQRGQVGEGDDLGHGRVKKNKNMKKGEMAPYRTCGVCLVPTLNRSRAHSVVRFTHRKEGKKKKSLKKTFYTTSFMSFVVILC